MRRNSLNQEEALKKTKKFWKEFYSKKGIIQREPSPFALWCIENYINKSDNIFEIGCGNGRDSFSFIENGNRIFAIDGCRVAIDKNREYLHQLSTSNAHFEAIDFNLLDSLESDFLDKIDIFYSRFVLHAIPEALEDKILAYMYDRLPRNGKMMHEFRTNGDVLMKQGENLSESERVTDHYRRFIDTKKFRNKLLQLGFEEVYFMESDGLAIYKEEDPVVARVVSIKV